MRPKVCWDRRLGAKGKKLDLVGSNVPLLVSRSSHNSILSVTVYL